MDDYPRAAFLQRFRRQRCSYMRIVHVGTNDDFGEGVRSRNRQLTRIGRVLH